MDDEETVRIQGTIPESDYDLLQQKFRASASGTDSNLLRALIDDWRRLRELEASRAAQEPVDLSESERE